MTEAITQGVHHVGLTVSRLEESAAFFTSLLGWREVRRNNDYPAIFVSDGSIMLTLWKNKEEPATIFDKNRNIGLHHIAFTVTTLAQLNEVHRRLVAHGTPVEFAPELLGDGPMQHMICHEPSGVRVEFIWPGSR